VKSEARRGSVAPIATVGGRSTAKSSTNRISRNAVPPPVAPYSPENRGFAAR
jgi:hypothetical protein